MNRKEENCKGLTLIRKEKQMPYPLGSAMQWTTEKNRDHPT